ncbi:MAG: CotH kinase family protein [Bacteroidales bacterium]|nr:CotH kinase family protein [Bacteroidales bacterium]
MRYLFISFIGFLYQGYIVCQNINPEQDEIFRMNEVCTIELTMSAEDKEELIYGENPDLRIYFPASIHFTNSLIDTFIDSVGVRNRGNTSIDNLKRPLKIDFREYGGAKFFDHKKFNLKPEHNDPSMVREFLSLYIFRESGVPAARASYANVYINDEYMGLYLNVEQIDDEFLEKRMNNDDGNLYKCLIQADLWDEEMAYNDIIYELKTNEEINDRIKLVELIRILSDSENQNLPDELANYFHVDMFLRYMAVEALIGHWDSPTMLANNYYLYEDAMTNRTVLIPYDVDNTLGIDWLATDWSEVSFESWGEGNLKTHALSIAVTEIPEFYNRYYKYVVTILEHIFNEEKLFPIIDDAKDLIDEFILEDEYYPLDWEFNYNDFDVALDSAYGGWVMYGVKPYISKRIQIARDELNFVEGFETLYPENPYTGQEPISINEESIKIYPNPCNDYFYINSTRADFAELYSVDGKLIRSESLYSNQKVSVSGIVKGLYILKIYSGNQLIHVDRLVVD